MAGWAACPRRLHGPDVRNAGCRAAVLRRGLGERSASSRNRRPRRREITRRRPRSGHVGKAVGRIVDVARLGHVAEIERGPSGVVACLAVSAAGRTSRRGCREGESIASVSLRDARLKRNNRSSIWIETVTAVFVGHAAAN